MSDLIASAHTTGVSAWVVWGITGSRSVDIGGTFDGATVSFQARDKTASITPAIHTMFDCTSADIKKATLTSNHEVRISLAGAGANTSVYCMAREIGDGI